MAESSYHHGNLRESLIKLGITHLDEKGAENISLRALAREIGVSQTAPYRHFEDKNQLLSAIAINGFEHMANKIAEAIEGLEQQPPQYLKAMARAYILFSLENTEVFKLMFGPILGDRKSYPALLAAGRHSFKLIEKSLQVGVDNGIFSIADITITANSIWASIHGVASLMQDRFDRFPDGTGDKQIDSMFDILINGMTAS
jgi:AcrR family transcriptional regulator